MKRGDEVFVDTNVIIEAHRVRGWKALTAAFKLVTAAKCVEEAATGDRRRGGYVEVDVDNLQKTATVCQPDPTEATKLVMELPPGLTLDPGERDLLACVRNRPGVWWVCSPDGAAVRAAHALGFLDQMVSLEHLLQTAKIRTGLQPQFMEKWLSGVRTRLKLDSL